MLKTKALILFKIETDYGEDALPTAAQNAILVEAPSIEPIGKKVQRANVKPWYGNKPFVSVGQGLKISFTTELKGSGVTPAVTPPEIGVLFRACNFTETIVNTVGSECVKYNPHSNPDGESGTIYFYQHNVLHKAVGCRGTGPELDSKTNEYGKMKWEFQGIYAGPVDQNIPINPEFNETSPPLFRGANFSIDGFAATIESLKVAVKNDIAIRPDANAATGVVSYFVKERAVTGEIDPEMVPVATHDFWGLWQDNAPVVLAATFGTVAGNRCVVTSNACQIDNPKYADRDNILTLGLPLVMLPISGDDEVEFKFN